MSLAEQLMAGHNKAQCNSIRDWILADKRRVSLLVNTVTGDDKLLAQRASWPLSYVAEAKPALLEPYLPKLLANLQKPGLHGAVRRNTMRLLQFVEIPLHLQGLAMDACFRAIETPGEPVGVKAFALTVLARLSVDFPEIIPEIRTIIEMQWHTQTPAFKVRARVFLQHL